MRHSMSLTLACALLLQVSTLTAQSAAQPTVAAVAGCYALTLGPWQRAGTNGATNWQTLPGVIRLDTALAARVPGWRALRATPSHSRESGPGLGPAWRVGPTDSIQAFWSDGFVGTRLTLGVRGDTLVGMATGFTDQLGGPPDPTATARAVRVACPAGPQRVGW